MIKLMRFVNMFAYFANYVLFLIILLVFVVEMLISSPCFMIMFHNFAFFVIGLAVIESVYKNGKLNIAELCLYDPHLLHICIVRNLMKMWIWAGSFLLLKLVRFTVFNVVIKQDY